MNLRLLLAAALLTLINLDFVLSRKTYFYDDYQYSVMMIPDSFKYIVRHVDDKQDEDVKKAEFNGTLNSASHLTLEDFPVCKRFKNLLTVKINDGIKIIDENLIQDCGNLKEIRIKNTEIEEIPENFFAGSPKLTWIYFSGSKVSTLPENTFVNQQKLKTLNLNEHQIASLLPGIFRSLTNLRSLYMQQTKLKYLNPTWFENLGKLKELYLLSSEISDLPKDVFKPLKKLESLYLGSNNIKVMHSDSFGIHSKLTQIDLTNNLMEAIDDKIVDKTAVIWLDMRANLCSDEEAFTRREIKEKIRNCTENYQNFERGN